MGLGQRIQLHLQPARPQLRCRRQTAQMDTAHHHEMVRPRGGRIKTGAKCLMQRKWVPIKDDVTYFDNKNEAEGIYI